MRPALVSTYYSRGQVGDAIARYLECMSERPRASCRIDGLSQFLPERYLLGFAPYDAIPIFACRQLSADSGTVVTVSRTEIEAAISFFLTPKRNGTYWSLVSVRAFLGTGNRVNAFTPYRFPEALLVRLGSFCRSRGEHCFDVCSFECLLG